MRLALLSRHGGLFIDLNTILVHSLDWLPQIASISSGRIFDRCGRTPKVFLLFSPFATHPLAWNISKECNTKSAVHLAYLNNFIAANAGSELIDRWLDMHLDLLSNSMEQIDAILQVCGIDGYRFTDASSL
jgi:hypothetical protein